MSHGMRGQQGPEASLTGSGPGEDSTGRGAVGGRHRCTNPSMEPKSPASRPRPPTLLAAADAFGGARLSPALGCMEGAGTRGGRSGERRPGRSSAKAAPAAGEDRAGPGAPFPRARSLRTRRGSLSCLWAWKELSCCPAQAPTVSRRGGPGALLRAPTWSPGIPAAGSWGGAASHLSAPTPTSVGCLGGGQRIPCFYCRRQPRRPDATGALYLPLRKAPTGLSDAAPCAPPPGCAPPGGALRPAPLAAALRPAPCSPFLSRRRPLARPRPAPSTRASPPAGVGRLRPAAGPRPAAGSDPSVPCSACFLDRRRKACRFASACSARGHCPEARLSVGCWWSRVRPSCLCGGGLRTAAPGLAFLALVE